jgi:hypothetical protein
MLAQIHAEKPFVTFIAFCKISSVFVAFVIFTYCDLRWKSQSQNRCKRKWTLFTARNRGESLRP